MKRLSQISNEVYDPKKVEDKIYHLWQKSGFFNPDKLPETKNKKRRTGSYCIVIPPPNITGSLHMGHALNATIQDILIRWRRLQGYKTLWLPGTDHASIATQNVVEKELKKEGKTRFDLGRGKFLERVWQWKIKYGNIILEQFKKLGCSLDWSRARFTLDKDYAKAVETAFLHYYEKEWIYKGKRVVNWCPRCQTSLSDLEIEYKEEKGKLWYIKYPFKKEAVFRQTQNDNNFIIVATTRPETILGDTAVAVNPNDKRYKNLIGEEIILPLTSRQIPIIADKAVDPKFGTGAVKVTPAHDLADYQIGRRHNLQILQVIDGLGKIINVEKYQGLKILEAREKIVEDLSCLGLVEKIENYDHQVPVCYRCGTVVELIPSEQWFLKMDQLAKTAIKTVESGQVRFFPKRWEKVYFDWLKNVEDWCISRQLWWGHKIPLKGESDVLDTWFSAALWPFATLGWPRLHQGSGGQGKKKKSDLNRFYPTDVLSTDRGIINLWVTRMIFSGIEFMKKPPFKDVYIHATVLTREGKRMSKSLGTGIDPINLIEKYGADATRFGIVWQVMGGQDIRFVEDNIVMGRKFCNKIWNASRFVLMSKSAQIYADLDSLGSQRGFTQMKNLTTADRKILKALKKTIKLVNGDLEGFRFGPASRKLYDFFWHDFCDVYIEKSKSQKDRKNTQKILLYVLLTSLKLLHPFIPFITEEIYQKLPIHPVKSRKMGILPRAKLFDGAKKKKKVLMAESWPS
jgi:valyl-tRNA synthetase